MKSLNLGLEILFNKNLPFLLWSFPLYGVKWQLYCSRKSLFGLFLITIGNKVSNIGLRNIV
jgi:hypothetical protein